MSRAGFVDSLFTMQDMQVSLPAAWSQHVSISPPARRPSAAHWAAGAHHNHQNIAFCRAKPTPWPTCIAISRTVEWKDVKSTRSLGGIQNCVPSQASASRTAILHDKGKKNLKCTRTLHLMPPHQFHHSTQLPSWPYHFPKFLISRAVERPVAWALQSRYHQGD